MHSFDVLLLVLLIIIACHILGQQLDCPGSHLCVLAPGGHPGELLLVLMVKLNQASVGRGTILGQQLVGGIGVPGLGSAEEPRMGGVEG